MADVIVVYRNIESNGPNGARAQSFAVEYSTAPQSAHYNPIGDGAYIGPANHEWFPAMREALAEQHTVDLTSVTTSASGRDTTWQLSVQPIGADRVACLARPHGGAATPDSTSPPGPERDTTTIDGIAPRRSERAARVSAKVLSHTELPTSPEFDSLTNLFNEVGLRNRLTQVGADDVGPYTVLACNISNIDKLAAGIGSTALDRLLVHTAARIHAVLRPEDFAAHLERGKFAMLLIVDDAHVQAIVARLRTELERSLEIDHTEANITTAFGVAHASAASPTDDLLDLARASLANAEP